MSEKFLTPQGTSTGHLKPSFRPDLPLSTAVIFFFQKPLKESFQRSKKYIWANILNKFSTFLGLNQDSP